MMSHFHCGGGGHDVTSRKSLRLHCFKSDWDGIWQECSSSKYASTVEVRFLI